MFLLLLILLVASVAAAPPAAPKKLHKYSDIFSMNKDGEKIITDPTQPIKDGDYEYYWIGFYEPSVSRPLLCQVDYTSDMWHLGKVRFANGSEPEGLQFGCSSKLACGGTECVPEGTNPIVTVVIILVLGAMCILIFVMSYEVKKIDADDDFTAILGKHPEKFIRK